MEIDKDLAQAKETIRELHGLLKDAARAHVTLDDTINSFRDNIAYQIAAEVAKGLANYRESLDSAIEAATQAVYKRFDTIADILTGEDKQHRRKRQPSITGLAERVAGAKQ